MKECLYVLMKSVILSVLFITAVLLTQVFQKYGEVSFFICLVLYLSGSLCFRNREFLGQIIIGFTVCIMETVLLENIDFIIDKLSITRYMLTDNLMICTFLQFLSFVTAMIIEYRIAKKNKKQEENNVPYN